MNKPVLLLLGIAVLLAGCATPPEAPVGLANPASTYCADLGYTEETRENADGQYGVCIFPDGSECDSWAFFRGECGTEFSYCARQGYTLETREEGPVCLFDDGSECPELDYLAGRCGPQG